MIREHLEAIEKKIDVRKNLIDLKGKIKDVAGKHALLYALENKLDVFYRLLKEEDPKIRKNVATILGQLGVQESLKHLYEAYEAEQTLFVRSSYLSAMKEFDYREYVEQFKEQLHLLRQIPPLEENKKHVLEEIKLLQELILTIEGRKKHTFYGYGENSKIILLTNRNFQDITAEQLKSHRPKVFSAGVMAKTDQLEEVLEVRTFSEVLFVLEDCPALKVQGVEPKDLAEAMAKQIQESSLQEFLRVRHTEDAPFYFRVECKNKMDLKQRSTFTRKLAGYVEELSDGNLVNSTSHYEVELRLVESKTGDYNFLIKLYTLPDPRFSYRKQALSTSIQPVNAALAMHLAKAYLKPGAQVLDPFCGVGTMLIERSRFMETGDLYGVDIFGKGIEAARRNTQFAKITVNYINRDYFDFQHTYLFDEIITNLPRVIGQKTKKEITGLYTRFWEKSKEHLVSKGILVLYCYDREILQVTLPTKDYRVLEEFEISKKEGAYCYVVEYLG